MYTRTAPVHTNRTRTHTRSMNTTLSDTLLSIAELLDNLESQKENISKQDFYLIGYIKTFSEKLLEDSEHFINAEEVLSNN